jgi:hypothetical protein
MNFIEFNNTLFSKLFFFIIFIVYFLNNQIVKEEKSIKTIKGSITKIKTYSTSE